MTVDPTNFEVRLEYHESHALVTVDGELDVATRPQLREHLQLLIADGDVHVDLAGVTYIDSSGLGEILHAHSTLLERGRNLRVTAASQPVARLFQLCGVGHLIVTGRPTTD